MAEDGNTSFFMNRQAPGFGSYAPEDDLLHREQNAEHDDDSVVETQFLGFNVPAADMHVVNYLWVHPNLHVVSGGTWGFQGIKGQALSAEMFDMRQFMSDRLLEPGDLADYELPSGYRVQVLQPLEKIRVSYDDPLRGNAFDVTLTAIMPPAMLASGKHFDQAMRTEGRLSLRGRSYAVDGYTVRDRSWGETRPEAPRAAPPVLWMTAVFGDDFAVHFTGFEDPASSPVWREVYEPDPAMQAVNRGWVWLDGELTGVESVTFSTRWDLGTGHPLGIVGRVVDSAGREFELTGTITAACHWNTWPNVEMSICLTRWECRGRTGYGDTQAAAWTDFTHRLLA
jgi:hypothetical protein